MPQSTRFGPHLALEVLDLSESGGRLKISRLLKHDQEVTITLESAVLTKQIARGGRVAWCFEIKDAEFCVGIAFDKRLPYAQYSMLVGI